MRVLVQTPRSAETLRDLFLTEGLIAAREHNVVDVHVPRFDTYREARLRVTAALSRWERAEDSRAQLIDFR